MYISLCNYKLHVVTMHTVCYDVPKQIGAILTSFPINQDDKLSVKLHHFFDICRWETGKLTSRKP